MKEYAHILNAIAAGEKVEYQEPSGAWLRRQPYGVLAEISRREFPPERYRVKTEDKNAEVKMNTMKDILQAIIEGKQLLTAGGSPIEHKTALNYLSRGLTVTIRPETVHRFVPVFKMPAGSVYMSEAKVGLESAKDPAHNGKTQSDTLAGVLHVEIEPTTMTLVKVEMVRP